MSAFHLQPALLQRGSIWPIAALLLLGCCYATRNAWLRSCGRALVAQDWNTSLKPADAVLVPTADWLRNDYGSEPLIEAAKLVESGLGASLWLTCPISYGVSECDIGKAFLTRAGFRASALQAVQTTTPLPATAEASLAAERLYSMGIKSVVVVVPDYQSRRLGRVYRRICAQRGIVARTLAVSTPQFNADNWWQARQSRKLFLTEIFRWTGVF
jgi:hypothetical protein